MAGLERFEYQSKPNRLELDIKICKFSLSKTSIDAASKLELKSLQPHMRYVFLGMNETHEVIIAAKMNEKQVECFVVVLKSF